MKILITENQLHYIIENKNKIDVKKSIKYARLPKEYKEFALDHLKSYTKAKNGRITGLSLHTELNKKIQEKNLPNGFDMGVDKNGYYIHTHRARSKSYPTPGKISVKDIRFIDSTG